MSSWVRYGFEKIVYFKNYQIMEKDCPRCGVSFVCRVDDISACHCAPVKLDELQLAYVKMHYPGCLCNSCLNEIKKYFYACEVNPRYKHLKH